MKAWTFKLTIEAGDRPEWINKSRDEIAATIDAYHKMYPGDDELFLIAFMKAMGAELVEVRQLPEGKRGYDSDQ